jgi:hypothetical protein
MGGIHKTGEDGQIDRREELGNVRWSLKINRKRGTRRETMIRHKFVITETPMFGAPKIHSDMTEKAVVLAIRRSGELGQCNNGITDVRAACNVGIHKLSEDGAIGEPKFALEILGFRGTVSRSNRSFIQTIDGIRRKRGGRGSGGLGRCGRVPTV